MNAKGLAEELSEHMEFLRRMARALVRDEQIADDVVQETMLAALSTRSEPVNVRAWLKSVLRRHVLMHVRTEQRRIARETLLMRDAGEAAHTVSSDAGLAMASLERSSLLGRAVAALDEPYRTVVVMRFYWGLPPKAIATRLERPVSTVNTQLQRGLERLRSELDKETGDRRTWVTALLPLALDGPDGWWPGSAGAASKASVGAIAGVLGAAAALFVGGRALLQGDGGAAERLARTVPGETASDTPDTELSAAEIGDSRAPADQVAEEASEPNSVARTEPGMLRLVVRTASSPVPGARITATPAAGTEGQILRVKSILEGEGGKKLKITPPGMFLVEEQTEPSRGPALAAATDMDGVASLPILDGEAWSVRVEAAGLAARTLAVHSDAVSFEETVVLEVGSRVVIDRGSFPLERTVFVSLRTHTTVEVHEAFLRAGVQEIVLDELDEGTYRVEALSAPGDRVTHWSLTAPVYGDRVARIDVGLGQRGSVQFEVVGASLATPADFLNIHGPLSDHGSPVWSEYVPVRNGHSSELSLPIGPAVVRVLSGSAEVGRKSFEVKPIEPTQSVPVHLSAGELRIVHGPGKGQDLDIELFHRSDDVGAQAGWIRIGRPSSNADASTYHGLAPGKYRLWVGGRASLRAFDLILGDSPSDVDARAGKAPVGEVRIALGAGVPDTASIEVETTPGRWRRIVPEDGSIELSLGTHRLRAALQGRGYVIRQVDVPNETELVFAEAAPPVGVTIECGPEFAGESLRIAASEHLAGLPLTSSTGEETLVLDQAGAVAVALRPGEYVLLDRFRRAATLSVGAEGGRYGVRFE